MDSSGPENSNNQTRPAASSGWLKQALIYILIFWIAVAVVLVLIRHPLNFANLMSGSQDRSLMAINSADLESDILTVTFIRSAPDKPSGAFILAGHKPGHSNLSNPDLENHVGDDTITFDGQEFEIIFESTEREAFPERSGLVPFNIEWVDRENGRITLQPVNQRAINHITSFRAFLLLTRESGEFYVANITFM